MYSADAVLIAPAGSPLLGHRKVPTEQQIGMVRHCELPDATGRQQFQRRSDDEVSDRGSSSTELGAGGHSTSSQQYKQLKEAVESPKRNLETAENERR